MQLCSYVIMLTGFLVSCFGLRLQRWDSYTARNTQSDDKMENPSEMKRKDQAFLCPCLLFQYHAVESHTWIYIHELKTVKSSRTGKGTSKSKQRRVVFVGGWSWDLSGATFSVLMYACHICVFVFPYLFMFYWKVS